jgi:hypothetical protein
VKALLKNRKFAATVAVIVLYLSLVFGTTHSLNKQAQKVEALFFDGVPDTEQNYTRPSINSQLQVCADAANGLITVVEDGADKDALRAARNALLDAETVERKLEAYIKLTLAFMAVSPSAHGAAAEDYVATFNGAGVYIRVLAADYNAEVSAYWKTSHALPGLIFGLFANQPTRIVLPM